MFFIEQIKQQFLLTLSAQNGEWSAAAIDQHYEQNQAVNDNVTPTPEGSQGPQTAETLAFQELNEELDAIDNDSTLVNRYTNILWNFLVKVRNGEIQWLSEDDSDFQRLLSLYKNKFEELKDMRNRGQEIEHVITHSMSQLQETVERGAAWEDIDDAIDKAYEQEIENKEKQETLNALVIQRTSYEWILREKIWELPSYIITEEITEQFQTPISTLINKDLVDDNGNDLSIDEKISELSDINTEILRLFWEFDRYIQDNTPEIIYTTIMIESMKEEVSWEMIEFRRMLFEDILWEEDDGKSLSEYKEHEKVQAFENQTPEWHQFGYSVIAIIEAFEEINVNESELNQEYGESLNYAIEWYERLYRSLSIVARDITELESGKSFGETRLELTHEWYKNLTLNEDGSLTEIWEAIANGDESIEPAANRLPNFEDLKMDQIQILKENWANFKNLFLVHPTGENFEWWLLQEWESYIINFSANEELSNKMDFSFIDSSAQQIEIDGTAVMFNQSGPLWAGYYDINNEQILLQDGSEVKIIEKRTDVSPQIEELIDSWITERLSNFAQSSSEYRAVSQAIMAGNPWWNFDASKLPWGLLGAVLAAILNMFDDRNFEYNPETKLWEEKPEWVDNSTGQQYDSQWRPLTNADVIGAYRWSMDLWSLSARFESSSQGSRAYNPDDNWHGPSYGTYQMNSEVWVHRSFIQKHGIADGRDGWMAAIQRFGANTFREMEHQHIKENNYDPMIRRISVPNKENFSMAMQNVIWSIGVQHGPWHSGLLEIINTSWVTPGDRESEARLINALYDKRERIWPAGIASRYRPERADALAMLNTLASSEVPNIYEQGLNPVPAWTKSHSISRSPSWTPECSKTARLNLTDFGLNAPFRWWSARESFNMYPADRITQFPPTPWSGALVADLYLEASNENAQYGHRVAAFKQDWAWFVFDPYYADNMMAAWYSIADRNTRIPAEDYIKYMWETQWREFWWAAYFK